MFFVQKGAFRKPSFPVCVVKVLLCVVGHMYLFFAGFEHYDVVHLTTGTFGIATGKRSAILTALRESALHRAFTQADAHEFRRCALEMVGIAVSADVLDVDPVLEEDMDDDASNASLVSSTSSSSNAPEDADTLEEQLPGSTGCPDMPDLNETATTSARPLRGKTKFSASFNVGCTTTQMSRVKPPQKTSVTLAMIRIFLI